ncbi:MAG: DNA-binding transcriptional LysR family regulator [Candidatus Aldehydirespiratoraceae bacterium]|jgi:DNA-binding transcriptional LysR family regulator
MDLRQLHALLAVAEHQSFSAAARALHTVQSNISTHVARLEQEVGSVLIDRAQGELTVEGEIVAGRARRIVAELRAIEDDLISLRDDVSGKVRAGVIGTTARWLVPALLNAVSDEFPRIELQVVEATTTSLIPQLLSDRLDIAVVNLPVNNPDVDAEVLFNEERIIVTPLDHPLAASDRVDLRELSKHEILLPPKGTAFRDEIDTDAKRARVELTPKAEVDGLRLLTSLAFQGFAPALVPASAAPAWLEGDWRRVAVDGLSPRIVGIATQRRTAPSAPTRTLADLIRRIVATEGPEQGLITPVASGIE